MQTSIGVSPQARRPIFCNAVKFDRGDGRESRLEFMLTPIISVHVTARIINIERAVVGLATGHMEPPSPPLRFPAGGGEGRRVALVSQSRGMVTIVIVGWLAAGRLRAAWANGDGRRVNDPDHKAA
jgi:hypothetical protein